ncbi:MAG: agmatinase [Proteobacteria bacterium]|nr:agmatinase [Pseudomonadota bacterium]
MMSRPSHLGLVALPFEVSTSFNEGTAGAPIAILKELSSIDSFDFTLGRNPLKNLTFSVLRPHSPTLKDSSLQQSLAEEAVAALLDRGGFPLILGGEHTVSLGPILASRKKFGELGVVQLDAHADLRNEYQNNRYSHACVMRRALEMGCPLLGIGIRTLCTEEKDLIESHNLDMVDGRRAATTTDWYDLLENLPQNIYLTMDMDVFDPAEAPAVGTPEPGGPGFEAVREFLHHLFKKKNVVATDIVELKPTAEDRASLRLAARLIGLIAGLRFD